MNTHITAALLYLVFLPLSTAFLEAAEITKSGGHEDKLNLYKVTQNIYAIEGPLANRTPENLGNNATFGFIITRDGVVLIDPGGTYKGAQRIHEIINTVTDKPVKYVINTGGQDHRWLGNDYFMRQGAKVIASTEAVTDQKTRLNDILLRLSSTAGDEVLEGTEAIYADITFDKNYKFNLGGTDIEIYHPGNAHSPGDSFVWLPKQKVVFTGDIAYTVRMLSMMSFSISKSWVESYEAMAALKPDHVIPGHGKPTTIDVTNKDTYAYLKWLRAEITEFMDSGGGIEDVGKIDQSDFSYLLNYDSLKGRNAQKIYEEIEFE